MTDDPASYIRKVEAMFAAVGAETEAIVEVWQMKVISRMVWLTPGPGNQYETTPYIATGRLRGGWTISEEAPAAVPLMGISGREDPEDAPTITIDRLKLELRTVGMAPSITCWNEVGYGFYVHEGLETHAHIGPRPFVTRAALEADVMLNEARAEVMSGTTMAAYGDSMSGALGG